MSIALHYSFRKIDHHTLCDAEQISEASVEQVYLKFCDLIEFPEWVTRLRNLTHINISSNAIEEFPAHLNILKNLNYLDISDNRLTDLPPALFELTQLRYLDVAGNFIEVLPTAIKNLKNLELLNFDRNFIFEIPSELAECTKMFQLSFEECARLFAIPRNLLTMPNLANVSFRACNLVAIPSIISPNVNNFLFSGNQLLNCIPHESSKFVDPNMSTSDFYMVNGDDLVQMLIGQTGFIVSSPEIKHFTLSNGTIANLPEEIEKIFTASSADINSLKELSLRSVSFQESLCLPRQLETILRFPTAVCTCLTSIFTEAFAVFFYEKHRSNLQLIITKFFCSKKCLKSFYDENKEDFLFVF